MFKQHYSKQYNAIINDSRSTIPRTVYRIFIQRRQAFVLTTTTLAPHTIKILQTMNSKEMCYYFLECLMLPILSDRTSSSISLIRTKAFVQFEFLIEVFKLELFLRSGQIEITPNIFQLYINFVKAFLEEPTEEKIPSIEKFIRHLFSLKVSKDTITRIKTAYAVFVLSNSCIAKVHQFEKRVNAFILAFYETIELMDIFEIKRAKFGSLQFEGPIVVLKQEVLDDISKIRKIKMREQNVPNLSPLNDWAGEFPSFNYGGSLSNEIDRVDNLVHFKPHIIIFDFIINPELFFITNSLQKQGFKLNTLFKNISEKTNEYNLLWICDLGKETTEESIKAQEYAIELEVAKMKKPSKQEDDEYNEIRAALRIKYSNGSGNIPKKEIKNLKNELFQKTKHIYDAEQVNAYENKKKLEKIVKNELLTLEKLDRIQFLYEVGFGSAPAIFFCCFIDFRTRIYAKGWPIGLQNGYFKHLLQSAKPAKLTITKNSKLFEDFWK